jgi:type IV pilus assembly protein PilY1
MTMKRLVTAFVAFLALGGYSTAARALDQYAGDTAIYGVSTATIQPNVLVILDNSGSMSEEVITGPPFDPTTTYAATNGCQGQPCATNKVYRWRGVEQVWQGYITDVNTITCNNAKTSLLTTGQYQGKLRTNGTCNTPSASFATGNYINWLTASGGVRTKMEVAIEVLTNLVSTTSGVKFGLMIFNTSQGGHITGVGDSYGWNDYDAYLKDMDEIFTGTTTNRTALVNTIANITPTTWTPLGETLFESMRYYSGGQTAFNGSYYYTTPIEYNCQKNYVILITDGMSTEDRSSVLQTICAAGDCDGDGFEPANDPAKTYAYQGSDYLDDVARYMYTTDLRPDSEADVSTTGTQNVITYTVGFGLAGVASAEKLLEETAANGGGIYYSAMSTSGLSESLRQIIGSIIEDNTSFVAPVVPVSPENRTYSGTRIYMGFFKPQLGAFWYGNVKKYGINDDGEVVDKNGTAATNADGSFVDNAVSYWSASADGSQVEEGGTGALLLTRATARNIYTYLGASASLTAVSNAFTTSNLAITYSTLDVVDDTEKGKVINYVHGKDAYDGDSNGVTDENRDWIMGDVLHSRPLVVNYTTYGMDYESDCTVNKTMIYVGGNAGALHAFKDCDGSEAWAFVPPDVLPYLKHLSAGTHTYYVDSSPSSYTYDYDGDGNIETADGDKVVLMFGERRGGDGFYYALNVTDPLDPVYMWRLSSTSSPSGTNTDYSELGESWSEPVIAKSMVDVSGALKTKVVAFVGAGYDNVNEDSEPAAANTKGRGVYAVEIATLSAAGVPSFTQSGYKVWDYTYSDNSALVKSIPTQLSVMDIDANGYVDRIYGGDMGGDMWRFDISSTYASAWTGYKLFKSNPGADLSTGRKIFYRPAVTLQTGYELLFFGTGDREHPTSTSVVDRLYAVKDPSETATCLLTGDETTCTTVEDGLSNATSSEVDITNTDGWYIKLEASSGEKALAQAVVVNKVAYFTSYAPTAGVVADPCASGNRGTAYVYAVSYLTTEGAFNLNEDNDVTEGGVTTEVLDTSDRTMEIGSGIPSGVVVIITDTASSALIGVGGALRTTEPPDGPPSIPTFWREVR